MITTIKEFYQKLDQFLEGEVKTVPENPNCYDTRLFITDADEIEQLACKLFMEKGGGCNWDAIDAFEEESGGLYWVGPGEIERFGTRVGCIHTPKGIIVYGY